MALTYTPLAEDSRLDQLADKLTRNVSESERTVSLIGGIALLGLGVSRFSLGGAIVALLGGGMILRGATGHCRLYSALGISTGAQPLKSAGAITNETSSIQPEAAEI